ncbi:phage Gp37/Gp68 family protein [Neisseria wadsworthii]|uniref:phage Gp37/Gp68 family protein n=1 Tax=Neisseria wadsworthii TaxID=607711 RepID=UPI000D310FDC|nr:phage Gp37/Gp68 family protein [Neisseria wadsworthii]
MANSNIEWTERTWNPITGCTKISPGCKNCYAESMAKRLQSMNTPGYENGFALTLMEGRLKEPADRKKPAVYFVNSMSDTFHENVPFAYIDRIFETVRQTPQHTYQVLTKRAERMAEYFATRTVPENVWLGVSVEDRRYGLPRIELLRNIPATVRFISCEPLLEDLGHLNLTNIEWVIVGGESGSKARRMQPVWVDNIRRQCEAAGAAFFFKQWGSWGADGMKRSKRANGCLLNGSVRQEFPMPLHRK